MHPFGVYLTATHRQRENDWERRTSFARVDATPIPEPERVSRIGRMGALVRRHVLRLAGA